MRAWRSIRCTVLVPTPSIFGIFSRPIEAVASRIEFAGDIGSLLSAFNHPLRFGITIVEVKAQSAKFGFHTCDLEIQLRVFN